MVWRARSSQREPMAMSAPPAMRGKQALRLLDGRREIGVGEHHHFAEGLENAIAHAIAFAAVAGILEQPHLGSAGSEGPHQLQQFGRASRRRPRSPRQTSRACECSR